VPKEKTTNNKVERRTREVLNIHVLRFITTLGKLRNTFSYTRQDCTPTADFHWAKYNFEYLGYVIYQGNLLHQSATCKGCG
jgi:hypothetical protein